MRGLIIRFWDSLRGIEIFLQQIPTKQKGLEEALKRKCQKAMRNNEDVCVFVCLGPSRMK
jgi:hypothetical protein